MILQVVAHQFRQPTGLLGRAWGLLMNHGNATIIAGTVGAMGAEPQHCVLEIGFGGGYGLELLLAAAHQGFVAGAELSDVMMARARKRFAAAVARKRLRLVAASVDRLPFDDEAFDRVVSVNTVYFWPDPLHGMSEIYRVLKPEGRVALGIRSPDSMRRLPFTKHGFAIYEPAQLEEMLGLAGFTGVRSEAYDDDRLGRVCIVADKPAFSPYRGKEPA
jgi:SAM-dependent methyltransferase